MIEKIQNHIIAALSDADLLDLVTEQALKMGRIQQEVQILKSNQVRAKNELRLRREGGRAKGEPIVSDHAVVRYLERHKGLDINGIRDEVREIAKRSKEVRNGKRNGTRLTDSETGIEMVFSAERNSIATVLSGEAVRLLSEDSP